MQLAQGIHRHAVDGFFHPNALLAVARDEVEQAQIFVELGQREAVNFVFVQVVQFEVPEVAQQDVTGLLVGLQAGKIVPGLLERLGQILAPALVLDQQRAFPPQVDVAVLVVDFLDALLEGGDLAALDAEDLEELVPETLGIGVFAFDVSPVLGKRAGAVGYLFPVEGHGWFR